MKNDNYDQTNSSQNSNNNGYSNNGYNNGYPGNNNFYGNNPYGNNNGYNNPNPNVIVVNQKSNNTSGLAIASLVFGILSVTVFCVVGFIPAFLGLLFGIIALGTKGEGKGMAVAGIILSVICLGVFLFIVLGSFGLAFSDPSKYMYY